MLLPRKLFWEKDRDRGGIEPLGFSKRGGLRALWIPALFLRTWRCHCWLELKETAHFVVASGNDGMATVTDLWQ